LASWVKMLSSHSFSPICARRMSRSIVSPTEPPRGKGSTPQ
jgi:hypothetical protein